MIKFEWDEQKRQTNLAKHRLDFAIAYRIFADPFALEEEDRSLDYSEPRYKIIGLVDDVLLLAVYAERGDTIRIISLRRATAAERKQYEQG
jgi:uncharacterized DUF497 family protein